MHINKRLRGAPLKYWNSIVKYRNLLKILFARRQRIFSLKIITILPLLPKGKFRPESLSLSSPVTLFSK